MSKYKEKKFNIESKKFDKVKQSQRGVLDGPMDKVKHN